MELKQQQAGVVEAREAVKQGEESLKQGRSIMLFTVVTIIFVSSLSYCVANLTHLAASFILHRSIWYERHRTDRP